MKKEMFREIGRIQNPKRNALSVGMTLILPMRVQRNLSATNVKIQGTNSMIVHQRNYQKTHLKQTNS